MRTISCSHAKLPDMVFVTEFGTELCQECYEMYRYMEEYAPEETEALKSKYEQN